MKHELEAVVYTDASVKPKHCGIGVCLLDARTGKLVTKLSRRLVGYDRNDTALEGRAVCEGIALAMKRGYRNIRVYTDSQSLVDAARNGKARKRAIKQFVAVLEGLRETMQIVLCWVRGHSRQQWNTLCDSLARNARWSLRQLVTIFAETLGFCDTTERILRVGG